VINLASFITMYLGVANTGDNPENKGQCVGLVEQWLDANKKPHIYGNACDLLNNANLAAFHIVRNTPTNVPPVGAIVVWGSSWGGGYGHCAVVVAANVHYLAVFEQNNPESSPPVVATHDYSGVLGWVYW